MADGYKTELEASKQRVKELEGGVEAASGDDLALKELQAVADGYKAELEASKQLLDEVECGYVHDACAALALPDLLAGGVAGKGDVCRR